MLAKTTVRHCLEHFTVPAFDKIQACYYFLLNFILYSHTTHIIDIPRGSRGMLPQNFEN
jgi:hypothetical protein